MVAIVLPPMQFAARDMRTSIPIPLVGQSGAVRFAVLAFIGLVLASEAPGVTVTWDGSSSAAWGTGANWSTGGVPANGDDLVFDEDSIVAANYSITLGANRRALSVTFGASAGTNAFTFTGNTLRIDGAAGIVNNDTQLQTFSSILTLGADQTWNAASGGLTFGTVNLSNNNTAHTLTVTGSSNTSITGVIANGGNGAGNITKTGSGTLTLSGANTYTGATNIGTAGGANAGTLTLGANDVLPGTTVNIYGGTLDINTRTDTVGALNLGGGASGSTASITGTTGTLTLGGNITYSATNNPNGAAISANLSLGGADRTITVGNSTGATTDLTLGAGDFSDTITMGTNTLIIDGAGNTLINAFVGTSGNTGGFTKNGTGTVTFYGDRNFYTGTTTVNDGTLVLDTSNSFTDETIRGNLVIGDGTGAADSATVIYGTGLANNKIANTSAVTINSDGVLNLNSKDDTIGSFTLSGGHITTGTGVLTLNGNIATTANAAARTAVIDGVLDLGGSTRTFTVANDTPTSDLTVNAMLNQGSIIKAGVGTMTITSDNTIGYGGTTTVNAGVLNIQHSGALGQTGASDVLKGTTVAAGAALQLQGGIAVGTEALSLSGTGVSADGALRNISGDNSWAGAISLAAASRINSDAGTLTVSGTITATNQDLTVGGAGHTTLNGSIGTGSGTLTKDGNGTLTLFGNSTYSGTTTINAGIVNLRHDSALGSTGVGTTVVSGATLQLQNNITVGAEALSLTSTGFGGAGALQNVNGTNSYGGAITVGAGGTRINSDSGTLTLAGNITLGAETLTVGGAGNTTQSAIISGTGGLTKDGAGILLLSGANSYSGATTISAGTLRLNASERINNLSAVSVAGGATFDVNGNTETIGSLAGTGSVTLGSGMLTTGGNDANTTFSGTLTGTGASSLTKAGTGTMTIGSNIGFGGDLNLTAGTLQFDVSNAFTGTTTISTGTLRLSSSTLTLNTLNLTGNTTIDFAGTASTLSVTSLNISNGVVVTIQNWQNAVDFFYAQDWTGAVFDTTGSTPMNQVVFNGFVGNNTKWQSYDHQITPVPEPSTYGAILTGLGLMVFGLRRWRQRRGARA